MTISFFDSSLSKDVSKGLNVKIFSSGHLVLLLLLEFVFYALLRLVDALICKSNIYKVNKIDRNDKVFIKVFIINIVCWGIWFCEYFPGAGMNDTINCIMSFRNDNQTLIYQLIIYFGIRFLTGLTNSMTIAYAMLVMAQMTLMSMAIAWLISWLNQKGIRGLYINLVIAYYAFMPAVADYSITLVKDTLFSICVMLAIPLLYEFIEKDGEMFRDKKFYFLCLVSLGGISVLRTNGKFIAIILLVFMFAKLKTKKYILPLMIALATINIGLIVGEKKLISSDADFRESIGIPLAQIGAVLVTDGYISETDREILNNLLPLDTWKESYSFSFADAIKFDSDFNNQWLNQNKGEFIRTWFSVLKDNFEIYIKAYLCHTYGFWNISPLNITSIDYTQSFFSQINNNTGDESIWGRFCIANNLENCEIKKSSVREQLDIILQQQFRISLIWGAGIMFWLCIWCMVELIIYRKRKVCFVFLPVLLNWTTLMIAAPISFVYRYSFYLVLSMPILFLITLMQISSRNK